MLAEASGTVMRSATGFDPDKHWGQLGNKEQQGIPCQTFAPQNLSCGVSPNEVKDFFGQINGDGAQFVLHGPHPPSDSLLVSFSDLIVADHSQSAQGRFLFINAISTIRHQPLCDTLRPQCPGKGAIMSMKKA